MNNDFILDKIIEYYSPNNIIIYVFCTDSTNINPLIQTFIIFEDIDITHNIFIAINKRTNPLFFENNNIDPTIPTIISFKNNKVINILQNPSSHELMNILDECNISYNN